jgi:hypothetical protein
LPASCQGGANIPRRIRLALSTSKSPPWCDANAALGHPWTTTREAGRPGTDQESLGHHEVKRLGGLAVEDKVKLGRAWTGNQGYGCLD